MQWRRYYPEATMCPRQRHRVSVVTETRCEFSRPAENDHRSRVSIETIKSTRLGVEPFSAPRVRTSSPVSRIVARRRENLQGATDQPALNDRRYDRRRGPRAGARTPSTEAVSGLQQRRLDSWVPWGVPLGVSRLWGDRHRLPDSSRGARGRPETTTPESTLSTEFGRRPTVRQATTEGFPRELSPRRAPDPTSC